MIRNYLKTALRNLSRHRGYTLISTFGLSVGLAVAIVIFLVVRFETSFDKFHKDSDRIYRVVSDVKFPEGTKYTGDVPSATATGLRMDYSWLNNVAAVLGEHNVTIEPLDDAHPDGSNKFKEKDGVFWAEPSFLRMFNFPLLAGDEGTALSQPNTALMTEETAERYFGDWKTAMGKQIKTWNGDVFKITGILKNIPGNTDFPIKTLLSYSTQGTGFMNEWVGMRGGSYCFIELPAGRTKEQFDIFLQQFVKRHKPAQFQLAGHVLQPLSDMHFDSRYNNYTGRTFSRQLLTTLELVAIFLLVVACINFINFATAQAVTRSREVGIRKVLGSSRRELIFQFLGETAIISVVAVLIATVLSLAAIPFVNRLMEFDLGLTWGDIPSLLGFLVLICFVVTILAGLYPAFVLSGFNPLLALKMKINSRIAGGIALRRGLVILQFVIAQVLIIAMFVVTSQMDFFNNAPLGFDKENVVNVIFPADSLGHSKMGVIRDQLKQLNGVRNVSFCFASPSDPLWQKTSFIFDNSPKASDFDANVKWADASYFNTYNLQLIAGKPYEESDTAGGFVVNETLVKKLNILHPGSILGKRIQVGDQSGLIVGVVRDFNTVSLRDPIDPVILACNKNQYKVASIRMQTADVRSLLNNIKRIWSQTFPGSLYEYFFLDERIGEFYKQEEQLSQLYKIFAGISIFISCLGLYALASFMALQRSKEVAVRKVLGASVANIIYLFSKEFTVLIGIAFLIAAPVAYYFMNRWLRDFAFRINLGIGIFALCIITSIAIAWLTVGFRIVSTARVNPVKNLRG